MVDRSKESVDEREEIERGLDEAEKSGQLDKEKKDRN